jgi:hypothetical protein
VSGSSGWASTRFIFRLLRLRSRPGTRAVAAEHLAFCPDNIVAGPGTIAAYAAEIRDEHSWGFWWD